MLPARLDSAHRFDDHGAWYFFRIRKRYVHQSWHQRREHRHDAQSSDFCNVVKLAHASLLIRSGPRVLAKLFQARETVHAISCTIFSDFWILSRKLLLRIRGADLAQRSGTSQADIAVG